jgi:hypothetical protein
MTADPRHRTRARARRAIELLVILTLLWCGVFAFAQQPAAQPAAYSTNAATCIVHKPAGGNGYYTGTGVLIGVSRDAKTALVITAEHVAGQSGRAFCDFANVPTLRGQWRAATVFHGDASLDMSAMLLFNPNVAPAIVGDVRPVSSRYYMCGFGGDRYKATVARLAYIRGADFFFDQPNVHGDSGGPIFDEQGYLVALGVAKRDETGRNTATPTWTHTRGPGGEQFQQFIHVVEQKTGIVSRFKAKRAGDVPAAAPMLAAPASTCPGGVCPAPGAVSLGGYKPLTPLAIPGATPAAPSYAAPAPPVVASVAAPVPPATFPLSPLQTPAATQPAVTVAAPAFSTPVAATLPTTTAAAVTTTTVTTTDADRLAARLDAIEGGLAAISKELGVEQPAASDAKAMVDRVPDVTLTVEYADHKETARFDLSEYIREQLGAGK